VPSTLEPSDPCNLVTLEPRHLLFESPARPLARTLRALRRDPGRVSYERHAADTGDCIERPALQLHRGCEVFIQRRKDGTQRRREHREGIYINSLRRAMPWTNPGRKPGAPCVSGRSVRPLNQGAKVPRWRGAVPQTNPGREPWAPCGPACSAATSPPFAPVRLTPRSRPDRPPDRGGLASGVLSGGAGGGGRRIRARWVRVVPA